MLRPDINKLKLANNVSKVELQYFAEVKVDGFLTTKLQKEMFENELQMKITESKKGFLKWITC